jgi:hypothetical protein
MKRNYRSRGILALFIACLLLILLPFAQGCRTKADKGKKENAANTASSHVNALRSFNANFSDAHRKDEFRLSLSGENKLDAKILFEIFNPDGKRIYVDSFYGQDLLYDGAELIPNDAEKEDSVMKHFNDFFENANFYKPASTVFNSYVYYSNNLDTISDSNAYYHDAVERFGLAQQADWVEISHDSSAIGFEYAYGYEGIYSIAYSKKQKKVVQYFTSD